MDLPDAPGVLYICIVTQRTSTFPTIHQLSSGCVSGLNFGASAIVLNALDLLIWD
jgi:hypothetical protein